MSAGTPTTAAAEARGVWAALRRDRLALAGAAIVLGIVLMALVGALFIDDPGAYVARPYLPPSGAHPFGTTGQGQDVLAQTVAGAGPTLLVGFAVGIATVLIGATVGIAAGYFGGRADGAFSLLINVFLVIPGLPLAIVMAAYLPPGPGTLAFALIATGWAWNARVTRAQSLSLRSRDFIAAAIVGGESHARIIAVELLPNLAPLLASQFIGATVYAVGAQVGLEFLGLGDTSVVTWGTNLYWAANDSALLTGSWWTFVPTGLGIALLGFGLVLVNAAIDEVGDRRLGAERAWRGWLLGRLAGRPGPSTPVVRAETQA